MEDLISGIMELSKVDARAHEDHPVSLNEVVSDMTFDFGLEDGQISFEDCGLEIGQDPSNFRERFGKLGWQCCKVS